MSCLLWEGEFYEDGMSIAERISGLVPAVDPAKVADIAIAARTESKLRHVPLLIVREMARLPRHRALVAATLPKIIQRADELSEFLALYLKEKRQPLSAQVKRGLAAAFGKFNEYELAKYNRDGAVKLRDVLFLCHAKPKDTEQDALWKRLIDGKLETPDTWEVALSAKDGESKKNKWERLLRESKLGALAMLRNLRNMTEENVDEKLIKDGLSNLKPGRTLPFRFIAAARYAPQFEPQLEAAMFKEIEGAEKIGGKTLLLVDVSGSMDSAISEKSEMTRMDAACGLAVLARELCEDVIIVTFSSRAVLVPARRGFALRDAITQSQDHGSTQLGAALEAARSKFSADRTIVITDEQSHDAVRGPIGTGYLINVASAQNGVGYGAWNHIDGWSESVLKYIQEVERNGIKDVNDTN
jgi:hypothetical protein